MKKIIVSILFQAAPLLFFVNFIAPIRIVEAEEASNATTPNRDIAQLRDTNRKPSSGMAQLSKVRSQIEAVLPKKGLQVGIVAASIEKHDLIYEKNPDLLLVPASVIKLVTSYTALKRLKPTYTFKTRVYTNGEMRSGKLFGDLYLKGGGDPSLVSERMWMLVNDLRRSGIQTISGNIVADSSYFDEETLPESRPKYLKDQAYNAPIGALSFNFNTTTVYVKPGEKKGDRPVVYVDPDNSYIDIVNQATTGSEGSKNTLAVTRTDHVKGDLGDTVLLRGQIPLGKGETRFFRNIVNPGLYAAHMFRSFWEKRGLQVTGNVVEGSIPESAKLILEFESLPLWQIVWGLNKFSNNFVADQILKTIGAEVGGLPGSRDKGIAAVNESLQFLGILPGAYTYRDGSGLTRETKVTAKQLVTLLLAAHRDFSVAPEWLSSLGVAGVDGTLKNRFPTSVSTEGLILRAKTGSLDGAASLAGYVNTVEGETIAFAVLLNDPKGKFGRMTHWVDKIALALSHFSRRAL